MDGPIDVALFAEQSPDLLAVCTPDGRFVWVNEAWSDVLGWSREAMLAEPWMHFLHPEDVASSLAAARRVRGGARVVGFENRYRTKCGAYRWLQWRGRIDRRQGLFYASARDVTVAREAALADEHERSLLLLAEELAEVGHWRFDFAQGTASWSPQMFRIFGLPLESSTPSFDASIWSVVPDDRARVLAAFERARATKGRLEFGSRIQRPDGSVRHCLSKGHCELDAFGEVIAQFGVTIDVTDARLQTEALERARGEALGAHEVKSRFLANMSHELRTPIGAIVGLTDVLLAEALDMRTREAIETIRGSARALHGIVDDILDVSALEASQLDVAQVSFDARPIVEDAIGLFRPVAEAKGLGLRLEAAAAVFPLVGDAARLRQSLLHLLGNAIKFTATGEVTLRVEPPSHQAACWRFHVRDTGIGIPAGDVGRLFAAFAQLDASSTRRYGGSGVGLALARQLVERMGGTLEVDSTVGVGSVFSIALRAAPDVSALVSPPLSLGRPAGGRSAPSLSPSPVATLEVTADLPPNTIAAIPVTRAARRVLVAEDNRVNQRVVAALLRQLGVECEIVADGHRAVEAASRGGFDLVLMDFHMPELDGIEAARRIHAVIGRSLPIVALTASALEQERQAALEAGMVDVLEKPLTRTSLERILTRWAASASRSAEAELTRP